MRNLDAVTIEEAVTDLLLAAHFAIDPSVETAVEKAMRRETAALPRGVLRQILDNYTIAREEKIAICQDSGMTLVYAEVGQDVHIEGDFEGAVNNGVRKAHQEGYLRASLVRDPLFDRSNTKDGTPAIIHVRLVPGENLRLTTVAKGFGSENNSTVAMFIPATTCEEIMDFIVSFVTERAAKSCPPLITGIGIGGTMDKAAAMAKTATFRPVGERNPDPAYADMEEELLRRINASGIGPAGFGGRTTALAVNIETFATHIASIPVAVNLCCHASRHASMVL